MKRLVLSEAEKGWGREKGWGKGKNSKGQMDLARKERSNRQAKGLDQEKSDGRKGREPGLGGTVAHGNLGGGENDQEINNTVLGEPTKGVGSRLKKVQVAF